MKIKTPTVQQLVDVVREYNVARTNELRVMPAGGFPAVYKNEHMDALYDCAELAARQLKAVLTVSLEVGNRKSAIENPHV